MKLLHAAALAFVALAAPASVLALGNSASLIDLTTGAVLSHFVVGNDPQSVGWNGGRFAYVQSADGLARINMSASPPAMTAIYPGMGEKLFVDPSGRRAIVEEALLDLTATPVTVISALPDLNSAAFLPGGDRAILITDRDITLVKGIQGPAPTFVTYPALLTSDGLAVAVNPSGTRAAVTMDDIGGIQLIDISNFSSPTLIGAVISGTSWFMEGEDPLGVAFSPDGTRVIYVVEETPNSMAVVINIAIPGEPFVENTIDLWCPDENFLQSSAITFNPATGAALVAGDCGVAVIGRGADGSYPYATGFIEHPGFFGTTTWAIAVNPSGTRAIVLNEDFLELWNVSPHELTFGLQETGRVSESQVVNVQNRDGPTMTIRKVSVSGPFNVRNFCPSSLIPTPRAAEVPPTYRCTVEVSFAPIVSGNGQTGFLTIESDEGTWVVPLSGDAFSTAQPRIALAPAAMAFGELILGDASVGHLAITNTGNATLTVLSTIVFGSQAFHAADTCIGNIAPATTCTMDITFTPDSTGAYAANLVIQHTAPERTSTVPLSGSAAPRPTPRIQLSATAIPFNDQGFGTTSTSRKLFVRNTGNATLALGAILTDSTEFRVTSACPAALEPDLECVLEITFTPAGTGPRSGELAINSNAANTPHAVAALAGNGCRPFSVRDARTGRPLCAP